MSLLPASTWWETGKDGLSSHRKDSAACVVMLLMVVDYWSEIGSRVPNTKDNRPCWTKHLTNGASQVNSSLCRWRCDGLLLGNNRQQTNSPQNRWRRSQDKGFHHEYLQWRTNPRREFPPAWLLPEDMPINLKLRPIPRSHRPRTMIN